MLTQIKKIQNLRNYQDFHSDIIFGKRKMVFYAPNGSGKTNLTRLFSYTTDPDLDINKLLSKEAQKNSDSLRFSFTIDDVEINESNYSSHRELLQRVSVFNQDFVDKNINCTDFSSKEISGNISIPLGEESTKITEIESKIKGLMTGRDNSLAELQQSFDTSKKVLGTKYQPKDKNIWEKFIFQEIVNPTTFEIYQIGEKQEFATCETDLQLINDKENQKPISSNLININISKDFFMEISKILNTSYAFNIEDPNIKTKILEITNSWIRDQELQIGAEKSLKRGRCILCDRKLDQQSEKLFSDFVKYFNQEEAKFKRDINQRESILERIIDTIRNINNSQEEDINKRSKALGLSKWQHIDTKVVSEKLMDLNELIKRKIANPTSSIEFDYKQIEELLHSLNELINDNNSLVSSINRKIINAHERLAELRTLIGEKYLYKFEQENLLLLEKVKDANERIQTEEENLGKEKKKIPSTSILENICLAFNHFLSKYIGIDKYEAEIQEGKMMLTLNGENISEETNLLSDGEKHMLGLCFFLANTLKIYTDKGKFKEAVYLIDDPVTSVSYTYFFGICSLLKHFHHYLDETILKETNEDFANNIQRIILTHNTQLFNMLNSHTFKQKADYFLLDKIKLKNIDPKKLMSEMKICLYRIYKYSQDKTNELIPGNDFRRFFETLKYFYGIQGDFNEENLGQIFSQLTEQIKDKSITEKQKFFTSIEYYSHGNPEAFSEQIDQSCIENFTDDFVKIIENSQFQGLWEEVKALAGS